MNKIIFLVFLFFVNSSYAGPLSYGICQTGCNSLAVTCYGAAGFTFGTITGVLDAPPSIIACNLT